MTPNGPPPAPAAKRASSRRSIPPGPISRDQSSRSSLIARFEHHFGAAEGGIPHVLERTHERVAKSAPTGALGQPGVADEYEGWDPNARNATGSTW